MNLDEQTTKQNGEATAIEPFRTMMAGLLLLPLEPRGSRRRRRRLALNVWLAHPSSSSTDNDDDANDDDVCILNKPRKTIAHPREHGVVAPTGRARDVTATTRIISYKMILFFSLRALCCSKTELRF